MKDHLTIDSIIQNGSMIGQSNDAPKTQTSPSLREFNRPRKSLHVMQFRRLQYKRSHSSYKKQWIP